MEISVLLSFTATLIFLLSPKISKNRLWSGTVIPLASIIGSGFLVVAPLLYLIVGIYSVIAMLFIVVLAYFIGEAIRFNIRYEEPILQSASEEKLIRRLENVSNLILSFAYVISVAFYLRLLSSFIFEGFIGRNLFLENVLTSLILLFIGLVGFIRGLNRLEWLEKYSVSIKLSVISSLIIGLFFFNVSQGFNVRLESKEISFHTFQLLAGILLIVQGFETSKYLIEKYTKEERIKTMKYAQIISGIIYVVFIFLSLPVMEKIDLSNINETTIIEVTRFISTTLPFLLILGAVMSQFSAAVADTIGSGELLYEETGKKIPSNVGFLTVSVIGILLIWSVNIFGIITYASKAFGMYYFLQTLIAFIISVRYNYRLYKTLFFVLLFILAFIVIFGEPVG